MTKPNTENPLVSIIVITYNSSKFVLETLESAKEQTYKNIELIVSDDCSTDNTVDICWEWLEKNKSRFVRTELITVEKNTGIPANCNRGVKAANGEWVKLIAGDDILTIDSINSFVSFVKVNPSIKIVGSVSQLFKDTDNERVFLKSQNFGNTVFFNPRITSNFQYELLLRKNYIQAPSVFINNQIINEVGGFDERFPFIEDHPLWLKITKSGYKFHYLDKVTVYYRIHSNSVLRSSTTKKLFNDFYLKRRECDINYIYPYIEKMEFYLMQLEFYRILFFDKAGMNLNNQFCNFLYRFSGRLSLIHYYRGLIIKKIEKQINSI